MGKDTIYLDYNATTPVAPEVREAICRSLELEWGNPSSSHPEGRRAREALEAARAQVAGLMGCRTEELLFTSGGTEGNHSVLMGLARAVPEERRQVIASAVEHPSILAPLKRLEEEGWERVLLPVDGECRVDPNDLAAAVGPRTALVSVMLANNETGAIQPVAELARIAHEAGALFHTDASQAVGKVEVDCRALGVDYLTLAGHKLYGPKGIGALFVAQDAPWSPLFLGGGQERGRRAGTEPVALAVGLGEACRLARRMLKEEMVRLAGLRDLLLSELRARGLGAQPNIPLDHRCLPNTLSCRLAGCDAAELLSRAPQVLASLGAACHSCGCGPNRPISHVLAAMGLSREEALGTIRFSVGRYTTEEEVRRAADLLAQAALREKG